MPEVEIVIALDARNAGPALAGSCRIASKIASERGRQALSATFRVDSLSPADRLRADRLFLRSLENVWT